MKNVEKRRLQMSVRYRNMAGMACLVFCGVIFAAVCFGDAARFKGGSYDGYDWNSVENTTVMSGARSGTIIKFR